VRSGIERARARRAEQQVVAQLQQRFASLTTREREIVALLAVGRSNKQIAGQMDISEVTTRVHRRQAMQKMGARSLADLVRLVDKLALSQTKTPSVLNKRKPLSHLIHSRPQKRNRSALCAIIHSVHRRSATVNRALVIAIVDDDDMVRTATRGLVESFGYNVETFDSAEAFLGSEWPRKAYCLIA